MRSNCAITALLVMLCAIVAPAAKEPGPLPKNHRGIHGSNTEKFAAIEKQLPLTRKKAWALVLAHDRKLRPAVDGRRKIRPREPGPVVDGNYFFGLGPPDKVHRSWRGYVINPYSKVVIRTHTTADYVGYTKRADKEFAKLEEALALKVDEAWKLVAAFDKKFEPRIGVDRPTKNALIIDGKYFFPLGRGKRSLLKRNWDGYYYDPETKEITRSYNK